MKYKSERFPKTECAEMFNAVKKHLGVNEFRRTYYSLYNVFTEKKTTGITIMMHELLMELFYTTIPTAKKEVPYNEQVKKDWLSTLLVFKESSEYLELKESKPVEINLEIYRINNNL